MIMTEVWTTAAAHGRVSRLPACSHVPPFLGFMKWILRNYFPKTKETKYGRGHTGIQRRLLCTCVSVYRETEVKEEKKKLIVHSVPLPVLTHPPFSPSRPLSLARSNRGSSRLLNGFQISSCWFSFWKPWLLSWDSAEEAAVLATRVDKTPYVDKQRPHMVIW